MSPTRTGRHHADAGWARARDILEQSLGRFRKVLMHAREAGE